ncbi:MAG: hypothetical protein LUE91_05255 [Oscillospiraceae bacterium]|nr:hypothetical protein [Oscillospiraceae bacterium]
MRHKTRFFISAVCFLAVFALLFFPLKELLARKTLTAPFDMTNKISGFYNEPEDEFEVLFLGSSHAYASFSPLRLWEDTGVKSYTFATQQQPLWATYTYLKEALKRQSPALVVVECNMAARTEEYYEEGVTYSYMDDIPFSWNKVKLAWVSADTLSGRVELLCNFFKYHGRWDSLTGADFTFVRSQVQSTYKGYVLLDLQEEEQPQPDISEVTERAALLEKNEYWLRKIIELCQEEGIELWLVKAPSNITVEDKATLNSVEDLAAEYGVLFHDFNEDYEEIGLTGALFYDHAHLDGQGAALFTDYFSEWMLERAADLAADADDADWAAEAAEYEAALAALDES